MLIGRSPVRISFGGGGTDLPSYYEQFGGAVLKRSQVDVPLGFEIQVQRPLRQATGRCDLFHGGVGKPFLRKEFACSIQNFLATKLGDDLLFGSSSRGVHDTDWPVSLVYYEMRQMLYSSEYYAERGMRSFGPRGETRKAVARVPYATKHLRFHSSCNAGRSRRSMHARMSTLSSQRGLEYVRVRFSVISTHRPVGCPGQSSVPGSG